MFLWTDDNLSTRYLWEYLGQSERRAMASFPLYARVACFKGYDGASFSFNTGAPPDGFDEQFMIYRDLLAEGFDMYAYVTFTAPPHEGLSSRMATFLDRLQRIHHNLPLRTVPLRVLDFHATHGRVRPEHMAALAFQNTVHDSWCEELDRRFTTEERNRPVCDVVLR